MFDLTPILRVAEAYPWLFPTFVFLFGACIGSFLNVVIYRLPKGESLVHPPSHNAQGDPIAWYDNLPLISWFLLRGRDRKTGEPFSFRYVVVEGLTAGLFLYFFLEMPLATACVAMVFAGLLIPASFIDLDHMILPDFFTIGGALIGMGLAFLLPSVWGVEAADLPFWVRGLKGLLIAFFGVLIGSGMVLWMMVIGHLLLGKQAVGEGDVFLAGCIGAFIGWKGALFAIFGGAIIGSALLIPVLLIEAVTGKTILSRKAPPVLEEEEEEAKPFEGEEGKQPKPDSKDEQVSEKIEEEDSDEGKEEEEGRSLIGSAIPFGPWLAIAALIYLGGFHGPVDRYIEGVQKALFPGL